MNKLSAIITQITAAESILLVDVEVEGHAMSALLTESPYSGEWLKTGNNVTVVFKETEVSLMKNFTGTISLRNKLPCRVTAVEKGAILGVVHLLFRNLHITSAITTRSIEGMDIRPGDEVIAMIKANEVSLVKALA
jgi:molybdopterin-binding protein